MNTTLDDNQHGYCPHCGTDLDGGSIYGTFLEKCGDPVKALEAAQMYGATESKGKWGKAIYMKMHSEDYSCKWKYWKCPDCGGEWGDVPDESTTDQIS